MKLEINLRDMALGGMVLLTLFSIFNAATLVSTRATAIQKVAEIKETLRPADLKAYILDPNCQDCFDIYSEIDAFKTENVNITQEYVMKVDSKEAQDMISKYDIKRLPALVLKGETDKENFTGFKKSKDALVYTGVTPPFIDANSMKERGVVDIFFIKDNACTICPDLSGIPTGLENLGIKTKLQTLDFASSEGKALVAKEGLQKVPVVLISKEASLYSEWQKVQTKENTDYFLMDSQGPYVNTSNGKLRGSVKVVFLNDTECLDCYDVFVHKKILPNFAVSEYNESVVSTQSEEGKTLIKKYNITKVPTILISGDIEVYPALTQVWQSVGTVESDGTYVFREISAMGSVKFTDLGASP